MEKNTVSNTSQTSGASALFLFLLVAIMILGNSSASAKGALAGLKLCAAIVIPALFPFTAAAIFFEKSGGLQWLGLKLHRFFSACFGISGTGGAVLVLSLLGGYPVGAKLLSSLDASHDISRTEANLLLRFAVNPSPAFCLSFIGESLLGSRQAGLILFCSNLIACLLLTAISGRRNRKNNPCMEQHPRPTTRRSYSLSDAIVISVAEGAGVIVSISAWVTLFSCVLALLQPFFSEALHAALSPLLEITVGAVAVSQIGIPLFLYAPLLAFGGLSTLCQVRQAAGALRPGFAFLACNRLLHGAVACVISAVLFHYFPCAVAVWSNTQAPQFTVPDMAPASIALLAMSIVFLVYLKPQKSH